MLRLCAAACRRAGLTALVGPLPQEELGQHPVYLLHCCSGLYQSVAVGMLEELLDHDQRIDHLLAHALEDLLLMDSLYARHFLLQGDVFTEDLIESWISWKRTKEIDPMRLRPTPYEFYLYYDP